MQYAAIISIFVQTSIIISYLAQKEKPTFLFSKKVG